MLILISANQLVKAKVSINYWLILLSEEIKAI
jgi:hypothetical protein